MPWSHPDFPNLQMMDHPLIQDKLTWVRDRSTSFRAFRALVNQIAGLMVFEVTRTFPTEEVTVETPLEPAQGVRIRGKITICPILRAGLGMSGGVTEMIPEARVGHIGLFRDEESLKPVEYLNKLPSDLDAGPVILVDPMLATGGSASAAVDMIKARGATDIRMICLVASPEGVQRLLDDHPTVQIYAASLDRELDDRGYIRPGLGDAGDRLFGTEH